MYRNELQDKKKWMKGTARKEEMYRNELQEKKEQIKKKKILKKEKQREL